MSKEHESLKAQARAAVRAYLRGREKQAPALFETVNFIIDNMPDNVTGWWILGQITGVLARTRSTWLDSTHDEEANAWYVSISDHDVDHTTEVIANLAWTRDGTLVGIELLPDAKPKPPKEEHLSDKELLAFSKKLKQDLANNNPVESFIPANSCPICYPRVCDITRPGCHKRAGLK